MGGTTLPFKFISGLGHGSFGVVLKAKDIKAGSYSAVKIIFEMEESKYIKRESEIMKGKSHPNVVKVINVFETEFTSVNEMEEIASLVEEVEIKRHFDIYIGRIRRKKTIPAILIEMELCGATLREWLNQHVNHDKNNSKLQMTQIKIINDIIGGMQFLHENKIIHRDFKPENVMFSRSNEDDQFPFPLKIGDFGLCRILHSEESKTLTSRTGTYMAPEMDKNSYNFQSDIFSLGLVIWEVAQLIPFKDRNKKFHDLVYDDKTEMVVSFDPSISSTIISMTKRKLKDRMKSMLEVDQKLELCLIPTLTSQVNKLKLEIKPKKYTSLPFEFVSCLGQGLFGIVLKAKNSRTETHSAVKIIFSSDKLEDKSFLKRECEILHDKNHPNVVKVLNFFQTIFNNENDLEQIANHIDDDRIHYLLDMHKGRIQRMKSIPVVMIEMEICGSTLREWINQHILHDKTDLTMQLTQINIIKDMVNGLQFLHQNKIIHRCFNPENIMFSLPVSGESKFSFPIKIGDFGLIRILSDSNKISTTNIIGVIEYMAPEFRGNIYNFQSDIFSLGLVIWEVVQLIPEKSRGQMFYDLVIKEKTEFVTCLMPHIFDIIIFMTKLHLKDRMKSIVEVEEISVDNWISSFYELGEFAEIKSKIDSGDSDSSDSGSGSSISSICQDMYFEDSLYSKIEVEGLNDNPITLIKSQLNELAIKITVQLDPSSYVARNGKEFEDLLSKCRAGDVIHLTEGEFEGPFKINCSNLKIIGQGSKTVLKCHTEKEITIKICGNNNCVSNIDISYTSFGVKLIGSDNSILNVGLIWCYNFCLSTALKIEGDRNKISGLKISKSCLFQQNDWSWLYFQHGIESKGDYNTLENIEINDLDMGINLSGSNSTVTNVIINNTIRGIIIFGSQNKISTIKYIKGNSVNMNGYECCGVIVYDSENDFEDIQCTGMGIGEWGFYINSTSAKKCKISNSSCGPLLIKGSEHTLINVDCGPSIKLEGMGHKLIKCKGQKILKESQHSQTFVLEDNDFDEVVNF